MKPIIWKIIGIIVLLFIIMFGYLFYTGSEDFETSNLRSKPITFNSQGDSVSGTLFIPEKGLDHHTSVALFVHGDGVQDRYSGGGYLPMIHHLVEQGIAVFSWDKKGVGNSKGNWLDQSIEDRAVEAVNAFKYLVSNEKANPQKIGYLGFSQGGWVIPKAATMQAPAFSIIIGGAVNWMDQGAFYTRKRLQLEGKDLEQIEKIASEIRRSDEDMFVTRNPEKIKATGMASDRFEFVARNYKSDSRTDILTMKGPLLAMWGEDDLNLDANVNAHLYKKITNNRKNTHIIVYPNATHGLLKAKYFNYQLSGQWPAWKNYLYVMMGRSAYVKCVLNTISAFINKTPK